MLIELCSLKNASDRWNYEKKVFKKINFTEDMIDHMNISSRIVDLNSEEGKYQLENFLLPEQNSGI